MSLTQTRSLVRAARKRFPNAPVESLHRFVALQVQSTLNTLAANPKADDNEVASEVDLAFELAVESGEPWAVGLKHCYRDQVIAPLVAKARDLGVDPVPAIVVETGITAEEAQAFVESLDNDTSNSTEENTANETGDMEVDTSDDMVAAL